MPIRTYHCRFCNQLVVASTRDVGSLERRRAPPGLDAALILPLPAAEAEEEEEDDEGAGAEHYSILLSTVVPGAQPVIVRRADGFETRQLLRCARCRLVMGYFLEGTGTGGAGGGGEDHQGNKAKARVVYLLPGALVETVDLDKQPKEVDIEREEWGKWRAWGATVASGGAERKK
jgi:hypothetical protein